MVPWGEDCHESGTRSSRGEWNGKCLSEELLNYCIMKRTSDAIYSEKMDAKIERFGSSKFGLHFRPNEGYYGTSVPEILRSN